MFPGNNYLEQIKYVILNPREAFYLATSSEVKQFSFHLLFISFLYLPLLSPLCLFLAVPLLAERYLSTSYLRWTIGFQYSVNIAPILAIGLIYGVGNFFDLIDKYKPDGAKKRVFYKKIILIYIGIILIIIACYFTVSQKRFITELWKPQNTISETDRQTFEAIILKIPSESNVSAQSAFVPHLAHRTRIYLFPGGIADSEYVILSKKTYSYPITTSDLDAEIEKIKQNKDFELYYNINDTYLFKRK